MNNQPRISVSKFLKENQILLLLAGVKLLLHGVATLRDHIFRDELYYIACGRHLSFGYVDHPPFVAVMAFLSHLLFGDSLFALRISSTIAGALLVFLSGILTRRLGGSKFAQGFAALCVLCVPYNFAIGSIFSMNIFDLLFWLLGAMLLVQLLQTNKPSLWLWFGLVLGIGLMNKLSMVFFGIGLGVGVLLTPQRRWLFHRWFWISGITAFVIFLPHILWQLMNGWPTLEFIERARTYKNLPLSPMQFLLAQFINVHPILLPVWLSGLWWFFFTSSGKPYRILGWIFITAAVILIVDKEKAYYLAPAFTVLMAAGAILLDQGLQRLNWKPLKPIVCGIVAVGGILIIPLTLPILPPEAYIAYSKALGIKAESGEKIEQGALPQFFADRYGWEEMAQKTAEVYRSLSPEDQAQCSIYGDNYGVAGAIDYFGKQYGLLNAICGHNSYFLWGPGNAAGEVMIVIGRKQNRLKECFAEVQIAGNTQHPYARPDESNKLIFLCRKPKVNLREVWPKLKNYI